MTIGTGTTEPAITNTNTTTTTSIQRKPQQTSKTDRENPSREPTKRNLGGHSSKPPRKKPWEKTLLGEKNSGKNPNKKPAQTKTYNKGRKNVHGRNLQSIYLGITDVRKTHWGGTMQIVVAGAQARNDFTPYVAEDISTATYHVIQRHTYFRERIFCLIPL